MWPFKKKIKPEKSKEFVQTKKVVYRPVDFEVGSTLILVEFSDGRDFIAKHYGYIDQYRNDGTVYNCNTGTYIAMSEPTVSEPKIMYSLKIVQRFLTTGALGHQTALVDDLDNPMSSATGIVVSARIMQTVPHIKKFDVAFLEDV